MMETVSAQERLKRQVIDRGLCTACGACNGNCPYFEWYGGRTVAVHACDLDEGRCYAHCPRTPTDLDALRKTLHAEDPMTPELGPFRGLYLARAADAAVRAGAQHGGTVSALAALALAQGRVEGMVMTGVNERGEPEGQVARTAEEVRARATTKFAAAPTVAAFNRATRAAGGPLGVVATPCQGLSYAKLATNPAPRAAAQAERVGLVIGLFCGWALDGAKLAALFSRHVPEAARVLAVDIPPSRYRCMEVRTPGGVIAIPLDEVLGCVRSACAHCLDMTCEFADLSVGSARSQRGWDEDKGWNQVIVRTQRGEALFQAARERGILEVRAAPEGALAKLKAAALAKKRRGIEQITRASGAPRDWLYLDPDDPYLRTI